MQWTHNGLQFSHSCVKMGGRDSLANLVSSAEKQQSSHLKQRRKGPSFSNIYNILYIFTHNHIYIYTVAGICSHLGTEMAHTYYMQRDG